MDAKFNNFAAPPGAFIQEEIEERGWSQTDLAYILGVPPQSVNMLISGKRGISADMAKALAKAFDTSAEVWANLQQAYDLSKAREPDPAIERRRVIQTNYPIREMIRREWIEDTGVDMLEMQVSRFFKVSSISEVPHLAHSGKKTRYDEIPPPQLSWLFRVRQIAEQTVVSKFSNQKLEHAIEAAKALRADVEEIRHIPRLMQEAGVRFVLVEGIPGSKIDGVCFWLDRSSPVIGMSCRFDRIDNFWFVFRHECEHVLRAHGLKYELIDEDIGIGHNSGDVSVLNDEDVANEAAADFCVPKEKMDSFYARKFPYFYERDTLAFAKLMGIHPSLVVGQIQKRTNNHSYLKKYQVKYRHHLLPSAVYDGWGHVAPVDL